MKNPAVAGFFLFDSRFDGIVAWVWLMSKGFHRVSLQAFLALHDGETDLLTFLEALETLALDGAEMYEYILPILAADEAEALGVVEPFDGTVFAICHWDRR